MSWSLLPEPLLYTVFSLLPTKQVVVAGQVCRRWGGVAGDSLLWRRLLARDYRLQVSRLGGPGRCWKEEYRKLADDTPSVLSEQLTTHSDEVLHVTFSNSGKFFVTCSKDGLIIVHSMDRRGLVSVRLMKDMREHGWQFTWASKFNATDSLLLVAGVINEINGQIAVFDSSRATGDFPLICKLENNPYDVMGAWCDETTWLSGSLSEEEPDQFMFQNMDATIHFCRTEPAHSEEPQPWVGAEETYKNVALRFKNQVNDGSNYLRCILVNNRTSFHADQAFSSYMELVDSAVKGTERQVVSQAADSACLELLQRNSLCLIFLCSGRTSIPHQIGFKKLYPEDLSEYPVISEPDHVIDMLGHVVGIAQDRAGKYLYVNVRRWPDGAVVSQHTPPCISDDIELRVVDLASLTLTHTVYRGHKGFTDSLGAFYIYLDTSDVLVGSGSEDGAARVWSKELGCLAATNRHEACVNCVAFSPTDPHMMVSVSDDYSVKVWMSKSRARSRVRANQNLL